MRRLCPFTLALVAVFTVVAAPSIRALPPTAQQAANPSWDAYVAAMKIKDADAKIGAMERVVRDFPGTNAAALALYQLVSLQAGKARQANQQTLDLVKRYIAGAPPDTRIGETARAATQLLNQNVLLDEAEALVSEALQQVSEKAYIEARRQQLAKEEAADRASNPQAKSPGVTDEATLAADFAKIRQLALLTLGQIRTKRGNTADAEKTLREAYTLAPGTYNAGTAALKLAELAQVPGRDADRLEYLTMVALTGRETAETRSDLESLYRKAHGGTLDGLEEMLDARYEKQTPKIRVEPFVPARSRADRVALVEVFTGCGCPPCVNTDLAFDAVLERYRPTDVAVLMYHVHIPTPDPMANPSTAARQKFYKLEGTPFAYVDGVPDDPDPWGMASLTSVYAGVQRSIERRLDVRADIPLRLRAIVGGQRVQVSVDVGKPRTPAQHLRLHIALAEQRVRYSGPNGVRYHAMVVRSLAGQEGDGLPISKPGKIDYSFDIPAVVAAARAHLETIEKGNERFPAFQFLTKKHEIDASQLVVVAFVQDADTKRVLQAASFAVQPKAGTLP